MQELIKEYLTFSRKERTGIIILMSLILIVGVSPAFFSVVDPGADSTALKQFIASVSVVGNGPADSSDRVGGGRFPGRSPMGDYRDNAGSDDRQTATDGSTRQFVTPEPFEFDPNTLSVDGWQRLGLREKTALTIEKYRNKGGKFRKPEDFLKVYGLSDRDKSRLLPYVKIVGTALSQQQLNKQVPDHGSSSRQIFDRRASLEIPADGELPGDISDQTGFRGKPLAERSSPEQWSLERPNGGNRGGAYTDNSMYKRKVPVVIEINRADTNAWRNLPGIGPVLSQRIIKYRDKLGGFYNVDQVSEIYGLADSVFQKIRVYLKCEPILVTININTSDRQVLEQHPYIDRLLARAIVDYRSQHGLFRDVASLKLLALLNDETLTRIAPYLATE